MGLISGVKNATYTAFSKSISMLTGGKFGKRTVDASKGETGASGIKTKQDAKDQMAPSKRLEVPDKTVWDRKISAHQTGARRISDLKDASTDYLLDKFNLINQFQTGEVASSDPKTMDKFVQWAEEYINGAGKDDPKIKFEENGKRDTMYKID